MVSTRFSRAWPLLCLGVACNAILGNEEGHLVDPGTSGSSSGARGGNASGASSSGGEGNDTNAAGASSADAGTSGGGTSGGGTSGTDAGGSDGMAGANSGPGPITLVRESAGCGSAPPAAAIESMAVQFTIATSGTKDPSATGNAGPWAYEREYYLRIPNAYDSDRAYPLVLQGTGCGATGDTVFDVYGLPVVADDIIRVGLTPPPNDINHTAVPGNSCFDDSEGDDSVEWPFYEALVDVLRSQLCIDQNRVFAAGYSSGASVANQLGCKYAGDANYPIRGVMADTGGLSTNPSYRPTCTDTPTAGIWVHESGDLTNPFQGTEDAVARAMAVNGCTIGTTYDTATLEDYPIGGGNPAETCRLIQGCPELYPLIVCEIAGNGHSAHTSIVNPSFATLLNQLSAF
jgi:poly(3-hydroxybutyrate) depolymerase